MRGILVKDSATTALFVEASELRKAGVYERTNE